MLLNLTTPRNDRHQYLPRAASSPAPIDTRLSGGAGMVQLIPALALCVSAGGPSSVFASRALIAEIATRCEPAALSKLMISATSPGWRMRAEDVAPLAKCTGLTSLVLNVSDGADVADVEYESLARRRSLLQRVMLPGSYDRTVAPRCTMAALGAFAGVCTHLESIVLSFDANMDVVPFPLSATPMSPTSMSWTRQSTSPTRRASPERLATLFPRLTWIEDIR